MQLIPIIYLSYMFVSLYMLFFFLILYLKNRRRMFDIPKPIKEYTVSIVVPCYNEEKSILGTVKSILASDYKGLKKVIVVDDCSTDNSYNVVKQFAEQEKRVLVVRTPRNLGRAASAKNYGAKFADTELIGFSDADSFLEKTAIRKCLGYLNDKTVAGVTCSVLVKNQNKFIERLQAMEYSIIAWTRKLLGYVDGIWAMPGPLALYRANIFKEVKGFDEHNLTEDIEIVWKIISKGYKVEMCLPAKVYSIAPSKFKYWFKQRIRWNVGGVQCLSKYRGNWTSKLGYFIIPFFALSMFLGLFGTAFFVFLAGKRIFQTFFYTKYSFAAGTTLLNADDFYFSASILNLFGIVLFCLGLFFTIFALRMIREPELKGFRNIFNLLFYMVIYLTLYPMLLVFAIGKMIKYKIQGKRIGWGTK